MATTGFWPVKSRLKDVIDYAKNPDKTTDRKFLDDDLYKALRYTENDDKTDQKMFVTAINCPTKQAYAYMTATKRRYGKLGGNVAYHGFQSFRTGEVTPEEAHKIGLETARRMWGKDYEIVVTTHLNTDNLHNHIVVNSVSFRTGRKFENHISDHYRLREISDAVCLEYGKSVLPPSKFTGSRKKDYWVKKSGNVTHRELLRQDMEKVLTSCTNWRDLQWQLTALGYQVEHNYEYSRISITAPGWKRAVRLDSIGYTQDALLHRFRENQHGPYISCAVIRVSTTPLLTLEKQLDYEISHSKDTATVLVDVLFYMLLQLLHLTRSEEQQRLGNQPHSPAIRQSITMEKQLTAEYSLLKDNDLHKEENILDFIDSCTNQINALEKERQEKNQVARELSKKLKPLRRNLQLAQTALEHYPRAWELLQAEHETERIARNRNRERGR